MSAETICIPNIGPRERQKRIRAGVVSFGVAAALAGILLATAVARPWRLVVFLPLWVGAIGIFQARGKTCVALVSRGERNMDAGPEHVGNEAELKQLRAQARDVYVRSLLLAGLLSAAVVAIT